MSSLLLKNVHATGRVSLTSPAAEPGKQKDQVTVSRIENTPEDVPNVTVAGVWEQTANLTWLGSYLRPARLPAGRLAGGDASQSAFASLVRHGRGKAVFAADRPESRSGREATTVPPASAAASPREGPMGGPVAGSLRLGQLDSRLHASICRVLSRPEDWTALDRAVTAFLEKDRQRAEARRERSVEVARALSENGISVTGFWRRLLKKLPIKHPLSDESWQSVVERRAMLLARQALDAIVERRNGPKIEDPTLEKYRVALAEAGWRLELFHQLALKAPLSFIDGFRSPMYWMGVQHLVDIFNASVKPRMTPEELERSVADAIPRQKTRRGNQGRKLGQKVDDLEVHALVRTLEALAESVDMPDDPAWPEPGDQQEELPEDAEAARLVTEDIAPRFGPSAFEVILKSAKSVARRVRALKRNRPLQIALEETASYTASGEQLSEVEWGQLVDRMRHRTK